MLTLQINTTKSNVHFTLIDIHKNIIIKRTNGVGFKGKRSSRSSIHSVIQSLRVLCQEFFIKETFRSYIVPKVSVVFIGPSKIQNVLIQILQELGFNILSVQIIPKFPHNGCRPKKQKRLLFILTGR